MQTLRRHHGPREGHERNTGGTTMLRAGPPADEGTEGSGKMSEERIEELLTLCVSLPYGEQRSELLEEALAMAEQSGREDLEYRVRLLLADACAMAGDSTGLLGNFRWCLDRFASSPQRFPADPGDGADLLWQYKWMPALLSSDPQIPAAELRQLLVEMAGHYRQAGAGLSAVHTAGFEMALANGWLEQAAGELAALEETTPDAYSHCEACLRSSIISYHLATGSQVLALAELDELLAGGESCGQEPEHAIGACLLALLRAGRGAQTKALHIRSYQAARREPQNLGLAASHIIYLAATGNLTRAVQLVERHLPLLARDPMAQREHLLFLCALGLTCQKLGEQQLGGLPISGSNLAELDEFLGRHATVLPADVLAPLAWAAARELAGRFDERNANTVMSEQVDKITALAAAGWDLDWESDSSLSPTPVPAPSNAAGWLSRAREYTAAGDTVRAAADAQRGLGQHPPADVAAGLHQLLMVLELGSGNEVSAREHLGAYCRALGAAGHRALAQLLEGEGLELHVDGSTEQLHALARLHTAGSPDRLVRVYTGTWLAHALMRHDDFEQAATLAGTTHRAALELIARMPADDVRDALLHNLYSIRIILASAEAEPQELEPLIRAWRKYNPTANSLAQVRNFMGQLASGDGQAQLALEYTDAALEVFLGYTDRQRAISAADFSAELLLELGEPEAARERLRLGLGQATRAEDPQRFAFLFRLAQLHVQAEEPYEAIDYLQQALENGHQVLGERELGEVHDLLAQGYAMSEQLPEAAGHWRQALAIFAATGEGLRELQAGEQLANAHLMFGEHEQAEQLSTRLVALAQSLSEEHGIAVLLNVLMLQAAVQEAAGTGAAEQSYRQAAELAAEHRQEALLAQILVRHAQYAGGEQDFAQAVSLMLQAANHFEDLGQESSAAQAIGAAASYLALDERHQEAVMLFEQSLEREIGEPGAEQTLRHRLADSLDALGQNARAATERRLAEQLGQ